MRKERSGKLGFILFLIFIIILIIGGEYLYYYVTNPKKDNNINDKNTKDYRIDKTKDYFYFTNEKVISESAEIYYKDVVINIIGSEHITETLNKENAIYMSNIKYISDQNILSDELINYNNDNIYMVSYREYKTYKFDNYVSLVVLDYLYDCFDQSTIKDTKSYVFDINTGKQLTNDELYTIFNTSETNIKNSIKEEIISKVGNLDTINNVVDNYEIKSLYVDDIGKLKAEYLVLYNELNYNDTTETEEGGE